MESAISLSLSLSSTSLSFQFFIGLVVINMGKYQPFDLIKLLLYYDLIELCFKIFNHLEAKSLTNCRLVSSHWRNFIDYQFNEMPKGRFIRSTNISNAYFSVEILTISLQIYIFSSNHNIHKTCDLMKKYTYLNQVKAFLMQTLM